MYHRVADISFDPWRLAVSPAYFAEQMEVLHEHFDPVPLAELRDEGLLEFRRGRGITVAGTPEQGAVVEQTRSLVQFARRNGYSVERLIELIQTLA